MQSPDWLFHPPSLYTLSDLILTVVLGILLLITWRRKMNGDPSLRRAVERVAARLDQLELDAQSRERNHAEFRRSMIDINERLLQERGRQNTTEEKLLARVEYVARTLDTRPCVANEAENGDEPCPDGHEIERKP